MRLRAVVGRCPAGAESTAALPVCPRGEAEALSAASGHTGACPGSRSPAPAVPARPVTPPGTAAGLQTRSRIAFLGFATCVLLLISCAVSERDFRDILAQSQSCTSDDECVLWLPAQVRVGCEPSRRTSASASASWVAPSPRSLSCSAGPALTLPSRSKSW